MSGIDDLREAYPKWSEEELQQCWEWYENLPKTDESVSFDEFARTERRYRQSLRDRGLSVDDPPHPESGVVFEYDPPFPRCPKCSCESYIYMDAPHGKEEFRAWIRDQGGKLQCPQCLEVFDLEPRHVPPVVKTVRLETIEEVLARKAKEEDGRRASSD